MEGPWLPVHEAGAVETGAQTRARWYGLWDKDVNCGTMSKEPTPASELDVFDEATLAIALEADAARSREAAQVPQPARQPPARPRRDGREDGAASQPAGPEAKQLPIGKLEVVNGTSISGWAWDPARPDEPISIDIIDGDTTICTVRADQPRPDLGAAGLGTGAHAFHVRDLTNLLPNARHVVRVVRSSDKVDLENSPWVLVAESPGYDQSAMTFIEGITSSALVATKRADDLNGLLTFLLRQVNQIINAREHMGATASVGRRAALSIAMEDAELTELTYALCQKLQRDHEPIHLDLAAPPVVSVIIPVFNHFKHTYNCIRSIFQNLPRASFEIIIADDCSTDETMLCGLVFSGAIRILRHAETLGFLRSCNAAAARARGQFLFFLNNDTLVKPGWLDELVATFAAVPNVGIAGSKLLFEDGTLQEVGGIVWRFGDGWNWGRNGNPEEPSYCYLRDADWVSGAALMIEKPVFDQLGGFDELYAPAYYEDTDLAFRVRALGKRVVVQPASEVVHLEGITSGTDTKGTGAKRHQVINHRKFFARWRDTLAGHRMNADQPELEAERLVTRRAFFIDDTVPAPDQDAGSNAALQHMIALQALGYKVTFLPADNMAPIAPYTANLQKIGVECLYAPFYWSVEEVFRKVRQPPDVVYLYRYSSASKYANLVRQRFPDCRILYCVCDLHYLRMERQAEIENSPALRVAAESQRRLELGVMQSCDTVIVHSSFEASLLRDADPSLPISVVSWTVKPQPGKRSFRERAGVAFIGGYRHPPNVDAALFLAHDIMPLIRARRPGLIASLVGSNMPREVSRLNRDDVRVVGYVPQLSQVLDEVRCTIVPLRYGAGIKGKVLESLAHGVPCVMTAVAAEGLELPETLRWLVADTAEELAAKVVTLDGDEALHARLSRHALEFIGSQFNAAVIRNALANAIA